jgi:hypothetical protein
MPRIHAYQPAPDVCILTCYFNPSRYATKLRNYSVFRESLRRSNLRCLTVECAFPGHDFALPDTDDDVLRVRGRDIMWQKERLLNIALPHLPAACRKIIWLDCDVLFANPVWAIESSRALDRYAAIQPYSTVIRLPQGASPDEGAGGEAWQSFAGVASSNPHALLTGDFQRHGHTGFAWGVRREVIDRHGFYDGCIAGSGDHMMSHALCGDWSGRCIQRIFAGNLAHLRHFQNWAARIYPDVRASVGVVPGDLYHLWHGETANRRYVDRNRELAGFGFDPATDIRLGSSGCWEWARDKPALHRWARRYFDYRREDGDAANLQHQLASSA